MEDYEKTLIPVIESLYGSFTALEKKAADFFIHLVTGSVNVRIRTA